MKHILSHSIRVALLSGALAICPVPGFAAEGTASELLEKGIYMEETKGDLEGAIAVYQQLVAEARNSQALAAQAQFRLGQCLLKKNRADEATAAFEKLIRDYPNEKDLVAKARGLLPSDLVLEPAPWADGERMQLAIFTAAGVDIGTSVYSADKDRSTGRELWKIGGRLFAGNGAVSSVLADPDTFRPVSSRWKHDILGDATAKYSATGVTIQFANKPDVTNTPLDKPVYDNEQVVYLIRRLPLKVGYKTVLNVLSSLGGGAIIPIGIDVPEKEVVKVPAGEFNCFKVNMSVMQSFWFSDDDKRLLVKFEAGGISAQLTNVRQQVAGEPVKFNDDQLNVAFSAPPNWIIHKRLKGDRENTQSIYLMDPEAEIEGAQIHIVQTSTLAAGSRQNSRAWADADLVGLARTRPNLKVRPESWQTPIVSGRPAASYVADYTEKERKMVKYTVHALGAERSETFTFTVPADNFAAYKPAFDSIVASYRTK